MQPEDGRPRVDKIKPNSFAEVIRLYLDSDTFKSKEPSTQEGYRQYLKVAERPEVMGALPVGVVRPALVQRFLDIYADRPGAQSRARTALNAMQKWALVRDYLPHPITTGVQLIEPDPDAGHIPWTDAQVATAEHYAPPHLARFVTLAANTGQRGSDLVKMRWSDIEKVEGVPGINVTQKKTGLALWIPFTNALQTAMAAWERRPGFILNRVDGLPYPNRKALYADWVGERDRNRDLKGCAELTPHGLRATAVIRLRRAGCPPTLIADFVGMSVKMVENYCKLSEKKINALAAVHYLNRTSRERDGLPSAESPAKVTR